MVACGAGGCVGRGYHRGPSYRCLAVEVVLSAYRREGKRNGRVSGWRWHGRPKACYIPFLCRWSTPFLCLVLSAFGLPRGRHKCTLRLQSVLPLRGFMCATWVIDVRGPMLWGRRARCRFSSPIFRRESPSPLSSKSIKWCALRTCLSCSCLRARWLGLSFLPKSTLVSMGFRKA